MKSYLRALKASTKSQQSHLPQPPTNTKGPLLSPQFPQCLSLSSRFPTTLSRPVAHPTRKKRSATQKSRGKFSRKQATAFLKTIGGESTLHTETSGYMSPRLFKTTLRENMAARSYTSSRKLQRNQSYPSQFPAMTLGSFTELSPERRTGGTAATVTKSDTARPPSVRQLFYRPPPTGPNSIYYTKAETQRLPTTSMALVARKLL